MAETSDNKTEQPTQRRLQRSREKGNIAYSADLVGGLSLFLASGTIALMSDRMLETLRLQIQNMLVSFVHVHRNPEILDYLFHFGWQCGKIFLPILGLTFFVSLLLGGLVTGFTISPKAFEADFSKLNPVSGWSKIFSSKAVVRTVMAVIKLVIVAGIVVLILKQQSMQLGVAAGQTFGLTTYLTMDLILKLMIGVSAVLVVLGGVDFAFQKWKHMQDLRMSIQEVKEERKEDEGDPQLKARMRRLQREVSNRGLKEAVSSSTVVITNPTHFAVALKYDRDMGAPVVVAKGHDFLAKRIIEIAKENDVAVVQRKPVARALYYHVEVGSEIPVELYEVVAEVLNFISSIDRQFH